MIFSLPMLMFPLKFREIPKKKKVADAVKDDEGVVALPPAAAAAADTADTADNGGKKTKQGVVVTNKAEEIKFDGSFLESCFKNFIITLFKPSLFCRRLEIAETPLHQLRPPLPRLGRRLSHHRPPRLLHHQAEVHGAAVPADRLQRLALHRRHRRRHHGHRQHLRRPLHQVRQAAGQVPRRLHRHGRVLQYCGNLQCHVFVMRANSTIRHVTRVRMILIMIYWGKKIKFLIMIMCFPPFIVLEILCPATSTATARQKTTNQCAALTALPTTFRPVLPAVRATIQRTRYFLFT